MLGFTDRSGNASHLHMDIAAAPLGSPMLLLPSRWRMLGLLLISGLFTAVGVLMIRDGRAVGWGVAAPFGLGVVIALFALVMPERNSLRLTPEGFTIGSLFRRTFIDWADVAEFGVTSTGLHRMVGFNYAPGYRGHAAGRSLAKGLAGFEGALPSTYGMKPLKLAALMSAYRAHVLAPR